MKYFLTKTILKQGFSGVLNKNSLLYVWDQLFMALWGSYDYELITKSILYLLRYQFLKANDYEQMRRVLHIFHNIQLDLIL